MEPRLRTLDDFKRWVGPLAAGGVAVLNLVELFTNGFPSLLENIQANSVRGALIGAALGIIGYLAHRYRINHPDRR